MLEALKRLPGCGGYTVHGFRSAFRDWCGNETAFARDVVEETYGHDVGNEVERPTARRRNEETAAGAGSVERLCHGQQGGVVPGKGRVSRGA